MTGEPVKIIFLGTSSLYRKLSSATPDLTKVVEHSERLKNVTNNRECSGSYTNGTRELVCLLKDYFDYTYVPWYSNILQNF